MDQLPLPNLQLYSVFSTLGVFYAVVYTLTTSSGYFETLYSDPWCAAAALNFGCCLLFQFVSFVYTVVFGNLQPTERKHMQDKFWNFLFYKFIFVFGVMNVQEVWELLGWVQWFALVGCLTLTSQLCRDRFQYLSFSPNTAPSSHAKIIVLLSSVLFACACLLMVCAIVGWQFGFNHFTFLFSEVFILFARTLLTIIRYIIHLWDMHHEGMWENRNTYTYYAELVLEMMALCVDFLHHLHMLLWANMFLSVASLILLMKLRFLYQEIQRRMKRHHNYLMVNQTLESRFKSVSSDQLEEGEVCAICWEKMSSARRLPCGHIFHFGCLRSWLEQEPVCPTCRRSLDNNLRSDEQPREQRRGSNATANQRRNWLLHFNGASIASWLPTFSLELHQNEDALVLTTAEDLHRGAVQVHSMFPQIPLHAIADDLTNTQSISDTVDNILNGSVSPLLATPLSTSTSAQGAAAVPIRTPPVSDAPTPSAAVKPADQEHATSEFTHSGQRGEESTESDTTSDKESLVYSESSTDHLGQCDSGLGFSDSDSGLRKRTSTTTTSSQMVEEPSSSQGISDERTVSCAIGSPHDGEDSTRSLADGCTMDSEERRPNLQENAFLTLQQRKKNMLQAAKHRYLQNHPH